MSSEPADKHEPYRFGDYELDVARRELLNKGKPVVTEPRVFNLLVYLLEHRDRAVDKAELQDQIWPNMIVTETALTRAVMKARRAVGDDADRQAVIKTLHGHGYRFVAAIRGSDKANEAVAVSDANIAAGAVGKRASFARRPWVAASAIAAAAIIGYFLFWPGYKSDVNARVAVMPLINATGQADIDWTRLGLMSLVSGLLAEQGDLAVVPDVSVLKLTEGLLDLNSGQPDFTSPGLVERLRRAYGATHIVSMQLENNPGGFRMLYRVLAPDDKEKQYTTVDSEPTALANSVARTIYEAVSGSALSLGQVETISDDAFVNEAFARGKSLSLKGQCVEAMPLFKVAMTDADLAQPRFEYAVCADAAGESAQADEILIALLAEQQNGDPSRPLADTLKAIGALYTRTGRPDEARAMLEDALQIATAIGDHDRSGDILISLAIAAKNRSEFDLASNLLGRATLAYEKAGRDLPPGSLYQTLANLSMNQGELAEAEANLEKGLEVFRYVGNRRGEAMMLNNTGFLLRKQGRLDEAEGFHLQSLAIRQEIDDRVGVGRIHGLLSVLYSARGQLERARASALTALEIARDTQDRLFEATSLSQLAEAEHGLGKTAAAADRYRESLAVFNDIQDSMRILQVRVRLARLDMELGLFDESHASAEAILTEARNANIQQAEIDALELISDIAEKRGDLDAAIAGYRSALQAVRTLSWDAKEKAITIKLAQAFLAQENLAAAEPLVGEVTRQPKDASTLRLLAQYAFVTRDYAAAVRLMQQARTAAGQRWGEADDRTLNHYESLHRPSSGPD